MGERGFMQRSHSDWSMPMYSLALQYALRACSFTLEKHLVIQWIYWLTASAVFLCDVWWQKCIIIKKGSWKKSRWFVESGGELWPHKAQRAFFGAPWCWEIYLSYLSSPPLLPQLPAEWRWCQSENSLPRQSPASAQSLPWHGYLRRGKKGYRELQ